MNNNNYIGFLLFLGPVLLPFDFIPKLLGYKGFCDWICDKKILKVDTLLLFIYIPLSGFSHITILYLITLLFEK